MYAAGSGLPLEGIAHNMLQSTVSGNRIEKLSDEGGGVGAAGPVRYRYPSNLRFLNHVLPPGNVIQMRTINVV